MNAKRQARRGFLKSSLSASVAMGSTAWLAGKSALAEARVSRSANEKIVVGVMGVNGRGSDLIRGFLAQPNVSVAYVCDVDQRAIEKGKALVADRQATPVEGVEDFRRILDDKAVDVLVCAAPNHWHAPATILGCSAGKHVYVEKPCSHTPAEGEMAVAAARKNSRIVQMGNQRRSSPMFIDAISKLHQGAIGKVLFARCWYTSRRGSIGKGKPGDPPSWLNFKLWQGPCTDQPYQDNLVHYNWHWFWHWGNGELGNNGVHALDIARWGMNVRYPTRVVSAGGRYRFEDDQQTADTHLTTFEFDRQIITWEGLSWSPRDASGHAFGISFHGDNGTMQLLDTGYAVYDMQNKLVQEQAGGYVDADHFANFLDCIRTGKHPNSDIEGAHQSTLLCHLGNIAHRSGHVLETDGESGHLKNAELASKWWSKEYRSGFEPQV
jgi:predicted dehydrogenase